MDSDAATGLAHTIEGAAANMLGLTEASDPLHGEEETAFDVNGCRRLAKRKGNTGQNIVWHVAIRPGRRSALRPSKHGWILSVIERPKARVRAKGAHAFRAVKRQFANVKVC